jgi:hypothetical protein
MVFPLRKGDVVAGLLLDPDLFLTSALGTYWQWEKYCGFYMKQNSVA